jgi:hypothetical protein
MIGFGGAEDQCGEGLTGPLEIATLAVHAGHSRLEEESVVEELAEECCLFGSGGPVAGHYTSFAMSRRLAFVWWMRSLATIRQADIVSRR